MSKEHRHDEGWIGGQEGGTEDGTTAHTRMTGRTQTCTCMRWRRQRS